MKRYLLPRLQDILFFGIFSGAVLLAPRMLNIDGDLLRHLTMGRYVLQHGLPPTNDIFSHTVYGTPFAPHEWLAGALFYLVYSLFGVNGLVILAAAVLAATFTILYAHGVAQTGLRLPLFFLTACGAIVSSLHWIIRPHLFSMLFLAIWLLMTERLAHRAVENSDTPIGQALRAGDGGLWLFPAVMLLWVNTHGEFIIGFLVLGAYLAGWGWDYYRQRSAALLQQGKLLGLAGGLSFLASLINPTGLRIWTTVIWYVNNKYLTSHTNEYNPPNFLQPQFIILLVFLAFSVFLLAVKKERLSTSQAFLLAGFTGMSLISARNLHLYGVAAPFALAATLTGSLAVPLVKRLETLFSRVESQLKGSLWPVAITLIFSLTLAASPLGKYNRFDPAFFPVEAVEWLKANPQTGNVFNAFDWGGYLLFNLWPETRVFIDGQTDVYGEKVTRQYEQVITLNGDWKKILADYQIQWVIVPAGWRLDGALKTAGWQEIHRDGTAVIYRYPGNLSPDLFSASN
jgi:hypothetical protein